MAEQKLIEEKKYEELENLKLEENPHLDKIRDILIQTNRDMLISISNYTVDNEEILFFLVGGIGGDGKSYSGELDKSTLRSLPFATQTKQFIKNTERKLILKDKVILNLLEAIYNILKYASKPPESEEEMDEKDEFEFTLRKEKDKYTKEQALEFFKDKDGNIEDWKVKIINRVYAEV